jgi:hypothetical protein
MAERVKCPAVSVKILRRNTENHLRHRPVTAVLFAALVATVMLFGCADERVGWQLVPLRVTPLTVECTVSSDSTAAWALFDRDTASAWTPAADEQGSVALVVTLDREQAISALKVFGASGYRLSVASDADAFEAERTEIDLSALGPGWNLLPLSAPLSTGRLRLDLTPIGPESALSELEIWAGATALESRVEARSLPDRVVGGVHYRARSTPSGSRRKRSRSSRTHLRGVAAHWHSLSHATHPRTARVG